MSPNFDYAGPYGGTLTLTQFLVHAAVGGTFHPIGDSGGVIVTLNTIPPNYTYYTGWRDEDDIYDEGSYTPAFAQIVVQHQFVTGTWVTTQIVACDRLRTLITWDYGAAARLGLYTQPLVEVDLYYLMTGFPL